MAQNVNNPEITVLMPVFNGEKYLKNAIESILAQTFTNYEFLIVNDGSTDKSETIIKSFSDSRIKVIQNTQKGLSNALNLGIAEAKGKYIARMDCDDIALPTRLEKELEIFKKDINVDVVSSFVTLINQDGNPINAWQDYGRAITNNEIIKQLPVENCIAHPTVMVKREVLLKNKYNVKQKYAEDWDLWLRIASDGGKFCKISEPLLLYRIHEQSAQGKVLHKSHYNKKTKTLGRYFINKLKVFNVNGFDLKVLKNACISFLRFLIDWVSPKLNRTLEHIVTTNLFNVVSQYKHLKQFCNTEIVNADQLYCFVPGVNEGEALKFYKDLVSNYIKPEPVVFLTSKPSKSYFKAIGKVNFTIDISLISDYPILQKSVKKILVKKINRNPTSKLLGSESVFYYDLLKSIDESITCMDILYSVVNPRDAGEEMLKYDFNVLSLKSVKRLNTRFVIYEGQFKELKSLYKSHNIDMKFLDKIAYFSQFRDLINN